MKQAWFVRSKLDGVNMIDSFKKKGIVATKVAGDKVDVARENSINLTGKNINEIKDTLSQAPYYLNGSELGNTRSVLDLFVNQMKEGDLVLVPDDRVIYFARIEGAYQHESSLITPLPYEQEASPWLAHQRSVTWLGDIPRSELSNELREAFKNQRLVGDLSKFYDEIEARSQGLPYEPKKDTIEVRYPLRPDFEITYTIPADMTVAEAEKLSAHFKTVFFRL